MSLLHPRSLERQLTLRLAALFLGATALAVAALFYQTYAVASSLSEQNLIERARALARAVDDSASGSTLTLPRELAAVYATPLGTSLFAVRDRNGDVIAASDAAIRAFAAAQPPADPEPKFFRLRSFGADSQDYYGVDVALTSTAGPLSVTVADASDVDALLHAMLDEFIFDIAWIIPIFVAATLLVGVFAIRRGLAPLRAAAAQAAAIEPNSISVRLPTDYLPNEVVPLIGAVNLALDRLEQGFAMQRRFTANAAHELRTPLAIVTAALDGMEGDDDLAKLRQDVARMNRLVDQLLRVARLDGVAMDVSDDLDLAKIAADVVEYMAPIAIGQERSVALVGTDTAIRVRGNRHAIEDALRNLVENAIAHTPPYTEVTVEVAVDGSIGVADCGTGVRAEDLAFLFDRFWRGRESHGTGAGLGLAIVKEIMKAHGGDVTVCNNAGAGARFTLRF